MLYQDTLTGYLYEVPETQLSQGSQVMYDGLGNPLGLPLLAPLIAAAAPMLMQAAGGLINRFLRPSGPPSAPGTPAPAPSPGGPGILSAIMPAVTGLVSRLLASRGSTMGELPASYQQVGELPTENLAEYYYPGAYSSGYQQPTQRSYQPYGSQWGYQPQSYQWGHQQGYQPWGYQSWYRR